MINLRIVVSLASLVFLVFGYPKGDITIINGNTAIQNSIPYQVYLKFEDSLEEWYCGGSLISQNYVLTAGYCTLERDGTNQKVTVYLGAHDVSQPTEQTRIEIESTEIITHESLKNKQRGTGNIGLVKLPTPVTFTPAIQPISLGSRELENDDFYNVTGQISGWGSIHLTYNDEPNVLHVSNMTIMDYYTCIKTTVFDKDTQLCGAITSSSLTGICDRDVGGPLVINDVEVGIIFYSDPVCFIFSPQIFTRVSSYFDWIEEHSDVVINQ